VVRNHVYDLAFHGSFSLKSVLPALVPGLTYDDLAIADGDTASVLLERMLLGDGQGQGSGQLVLFAAAPSPVRADLLAYCKRDTWAMVKLLERLRGLV